MNAPAPDDDPRDPHLLAALRHAPDRDALPPAPVTAAILGHARQAVRPARAAAPAWRAGLRAAFARLWQPAPLAAFGTLAMATLIGVMWGGQPVPDATPGLRPEHAAPAPSAPRDAAVAVGSTAAVLPASRDVASEQKEAAPDAGPSKPRLAQAPSSPPAAKAKSSRPAATPPPETAIARADAMQEREARRDIADAVAPQVAAAPAPAPAPSPAPAPAPLQSGALAKSAADAAPNLLRARSERAAPALGANTGAAPLAGAAAEIDAATSSDAARVRWRITPQRTVAHEAAQRAWWAAVQTATQGRWQGASASSGSGAASEALTLLIDGAARGRLAFEPLAIVWHDANGATWRAPIEAPTLRAWQEALTRW